MSCSRRGRHLAPHDPSLACRASTLPPMFFSDDRARDRAAERTRMVDLQIRSRGIDDASVLAAMRAVPRHRFVPESEQAAAYDDCPLPVGHGQTISQPYMVAAMSAALGLTPRARALEVGTGSGYQAAILARLAADVVTVEWVPELAARARAVLETLGAANVTVVTGDGTTGGAGGRFDAILVAAGAPRVPAVLREQLADDGRLVMPVGTPEQQVLTVVRRCGAVFQEQASAPCRFVPLRGRHGWEFAARESGVAR